MKVSYVESLANCYGLHRRCGGGNDPVLSVRHGGKRRPATELRNLNFRVPTWSLYREGYIDISAHGEGMPDTAESTNLCMRGNLKRENREIRVASVPSIAWISDAWWQSGQGTVQRERLS